MYRIVEITVVIFITKNRVMKMKVNTKEMVAGGVVFAALSGAALAAYQYRQKKNSYAKPFDESTVEEVKGEVLEIQYSGKENDKSRGVELHLKTEENEILVHLGPAWYIDNQHKKIEAGQKITVRGSKIGDDSEPLLIAEWVQTGKQQFRLRDKTGHPVWDAWNGQSM